MANPQLAGLVRTLQIIAGALIMGIAMFAVVTLVLVKWDKVNIEFSPLGLVALIVPLVLSVFSAFVPGVIFKQAVTQFASRNPKPELQSLLRASGEAATVRTIIGLALAEGGGFLALIIWMISGNILGLIGAFICLAAMILKFPTYGKVEQQLADFRQELKLQQRSV